MFSPFGPSTTVPEPIKFKDGHTLSVKPQEFLLTNDSGETVTIDLERAIEVGTDGTSFLIPVDEDDVTVASMDEAFQIASALAMTISVNGKSYQVGEALDMFGGEDLFGALSALGGAIDVDAGDPEDVWATPDL